MASDSQAPGSPLTPMTSASLLPEKSPEEVAVVSEVPELPPDPDTALVSEPEEEVLRFKIGGPDVPTSSAVESSASEHPSSNERARNALGIAICVVVWDDIGNSSHCPT